MDSSRASVKKCLSTTFGAKLANTYEKAIYDMVLSDSTPSNETYARLAYEKVGQLIECNQDPDSIEGILANISSGITGYESSIYEPQRIKHEKALAQAIQKPKAIKGTYVCKFPRGCGSDEFYIWKLQTRGGDEGTTTFRQCAKCGRRGKED